MKYTLREIAVFDSMKPLFPFLLVVGIGGWLLRHDDWWFLAWWAGSCLLWLAWMAYGYLVEGVAMKQSEFLALPEVVGVALFQKPEDGEVCDAEGQLWMIGWCGGVRVRQRVGVAPDVANLTNKPVDNSPSP